MYWHGGNLSYSSMILHIKTARMKIKIVMNNKNIKNLSTKHALLIT